jgi:hypothetical protein
MVMKQEKKHIKMYEENVTNYSHENKEDKDEDELGDKI